MLDNRCLIIFTDLDGTLLDPESYSYEAALPILADLKTRQVPVIPVTSKTRQEVETLRQQLAMNDPFIVENGSGIFIAEDDKRFVLDGEAGEGYHLLRLGCTYTQAREGLQAVAQALNESLRGFGDLSDNEVSQLTGLPLEAVKQAKAREFSEPFITPKSSTSQQLEQAVQAAGFRVVVGDRFCHLIGSGAGKGKAVNRLKQAYQSAMPEVRLLTVGLGNSPNDREMLEAVDIPIIVPGKKGPHPGLIGKGWQVAPAVGDRGWAQAVRAIYEG